MSREISPRHVLEVLYAARDRIGDPDTDWRFEQWTSCTCGHIYTAATGRKSKTGDTVTARRDKADRVYLQVMERAATALGWTGWMQTEADPEVFFNTPYAYVSDYTHKLAGGNYVGREHAIRVIDDAIHVIESVEEAARAELVLTSLETAINQAAAIEPAVREEVLV